MRVRIQQQSRLASFIMTVAMLLVVQSARAQGYVVHVQSPSEIAPGASAQIVFSFTVVDPTITSLTLTPSGPAGITIMPPSQTTTRSAAASPVLPPFPPLIFVVSVAPNAAPGPSIIPVQITVNGQGGSRIDTNSIAINVLPQDFRITVAPPSVALSAGETQTLIVSVTPVNFSQPGSAPNVTVTIAPADGVTVSPSSFTVTPPGTQMVAVTVSPTITGRIPLSVTARSATLTHTARVDVQILPAAVTIVPSSVTTPSLPTTLRAGGTNFSPGGKFISRSRDIVVLGTTVYNATLADVDVSVREGAAIGAHVLVFQNPDGAVSARAGTVYVVPAGGIGAPLGVANASIVFPVDGTLIGANEQVYPRAMVATTGTGTISGIWKIDDAPFDRFTITASPGPVEVRTHVAVPPSTSGVHKIKLIIETPRLASDPPEVSYTAVRETVTRLSFYEPSERAVVESNPRIRWSLVPGATGYELELRKIAANGLESGGTRIRTTQTAWKPVDAFTGMIRFRVRAIFPGDVRGEPTPWSTATFLPRKVSLHIDAAAAARVAWSGGALGMIYRVEFQRAGARCFDALTFTPEYRLPNAIAWRDCDSVRVRAAAPSGTPVGESELRRLSASFAPAAMLAHARPSLEIVEQEPRAATTAAARTAIAVRWRNGDERDAALLVDGVDVTPVSVRQPGGIRYEALVPLRAGRHMAALSTPAGITEWVFTSVDEPVAMSAAVVPPPAYVVSPTGTVTWRSDAKPQDHDGETLALSSQGQAGDVNAGTGGSVTGNLNYRGAADPTHVAQASHDWIAEGRTGHDAAFASARLGYATPDFTDAAKYLVSGTARTGVIARAGTAFGTISYYEPIGSAVHSASSAASEPASIHAVALSTPEGRPYIVRLIDLDIRERPDVLAGTGGAMTRTYGLFARYTFSSKLELVGELAHGTLSGVSAAMRGNAIRMALSGTVAGTTYGFRISKVDPDFVTPANRVFTAGFNNRLDTELSLARSVGKAAFTLDAGRYAQSRAHDTPNGTKNTATIGMSAPLSARVALETSAGFTRDSAERTVPLPLGTNRLESRASTKLTESFSKISVSEDVKWSRTDDHAEPANDVTTNDVTVSANGSLMTNVTVASSAGFTRTKASPLVGMTDRWMLSFTPAVAVPRLLISIRPSVSIDRSTTDVTHTFTHAAIYGTAIDWQPAWRESLISGQLSGTQTLMNSTSMSSRPRVRAATASVTLHAKKVRGLPMFAAPAPLPGTAPPTPPEANVPQAEPQPKG